MTLDVVSPSRILEMGHAYRACRTLLSAVELGVFKMLAAGPLDRDALTRRAGINPRGARDFLDALVALGMLERSDDGCYSNSKEAALYLDPHMPTYVGGLLERFSIWDYGVWNSLTVALRTGKPQYSRSADSALYVDAVSHDLFARGMTVRTRVVGEALARKFPWEDHDTLIDVGTAQGCLPVCIAQAHAHVTGGGFDLPAFAATFEGYVEHHGLSSRLRFQPGDFFHDPLPAADVLVFGRVLHNWDLPTKTMLLKKAYDALPADGALIIYERLIDDERRVNTAALLSSLQMLLGSTGGFDFTAADCVSWMCEIGFHDIRVEPLTTDQSMVVGLK